MEALNSMLWLAQAVRDKLFGALPQDLSLIVSTNPLTKAYLSGYVSIVHDLAPSYRSAVLARRDAAALVASAADAAPAFEFLGRVDLIYRYGEFFFDRTESVPEVLGQLPSARFEPVFVKALSEQAGQGRIGVDRSDNDLLWLICMDVLGEDRLVDVTQPLLACRALKLPQEVARLRRAAACVEAGFARIMEIARAGMTEQDLAVLNFTRN